MPQVGSEILNQSNGDMKIRRHYDFTPEFQHSHELKQEYANGNGGMSQTRELRHVARIPVELADVDPLVAAALRGDKVCLRLAMAKYPAIKTCTGGV